MAQRRIDEQIFDEYEPTEEEKHFEFNIQVSDLLNEKPNLYQTSPFIFRNTMAQGILGLNRMVKAEQNSLLAVDTRDSLEKAYFMGKVVWYCKTATGTMGIGAKA